MTNNHLQVDGPEEIVYQGRIFEIVRQKMKAGDQQVIFEIARRSPGVRLIIVKDNQLLISKEFRSELNDYDYRLPGGKVFNSLEEYKKNQSDDIWPQAQEAVRRECREETGLIAKHISYFATAPAGATVVWDLLYFIIDEFEESGSGPELEAGEEIETSWKSFAEVKQLCEEGKISEARTLGILFKFFLKYPENYTQ